MDPTYCRHPLENNVVTIGDNPEILDFCRSRGAQRKPGLPSNADV